MFRMILIAVACSSVPALATDHTEVIDTPAGEEPSSPGSICAPSIACAAKLVDADGFQVAFGSDGRTGDGALVHEGQMSLSYALAEGFEFDLVTTGVHLLGEGRTQVSADGVQPGLKVALLPEGTWAPSNDVSVHLTVPTLNSTNSTQWSFEAWYYLSKTVAFVRADLNLMLGVVDLAGTPTAQGMATLTLSADLGHGVGIFGEAFGTWGETQARLPGVGTFAGVSYRVAPSVSLDVGGEVAFHQDGKAFTAFAGFTWVPQTAGRAAELALPSQWPPAAVALLDR